MAITRTAKGTNSSKADTTSLSINNVAMDAGSTILVGVVFFASAGNPTVKWGKKDLKRDKTNEHATAGHRTQWYSARVRKARTLDVVLTWGTSTPGARAALVTQITESSVEDVSVVNDNNNSTTPNTSSAGDSTIANTISMALFGSNGPDTDAQGTANLGHTLGQRIGTSGGADTSNVTLQETYEILSATGVVRSSLTVTTARDWANLIVAFAAAQTFTVKEVIQHHRDINEEPDWVRVRIEDESGGGFWWLIPPEDFDSWSDAEVTEEITRACTYRAARNIDIDSNVDEDSARDTRMATFVNDTIIV